MVPEGWKAVTLDRLGASDKPAIKAGPFGSSIKKEFYVGVAIKFIVKNRLLLETYQLENTILMSNFITASDCVRHGQVNPCLHQNHVFVVRSRKDILLPEFLAAQTGSNYGKQYFLSCAKQTTNLASINSTQLREFPALLPPLNEQKLIIEILDSICLAELTAQQELRALEKLKNGLIPI